MESTPHEFDESWEHYMDMERSQLRDRVSGRMARALGRPVRGESQEELDRIAEEDQSLARRGLVKLEKEDGEVYYLHIDELTRQNRPDRIRAEKKQVAWLKDRLGRAP